MKKIKPKLADPKVEDYNGVLPEPNYYPPIIDEEVIENFKN